MDEQKIRKIVQDEIRRSQGASRFGINQIPYHTHDGIDSNPVFLPTITYTGYVPSDGLVTNSPFVFLPSGWTVELQVGNIYKITHNLNTDFYTVMACMTGPEANDAFTPLTVCQSNFFEIAWSFNSTLTLTTDFQFTLVQVNNRRSSLTTYSTSS